MSAETSAWLNSMTLIGFTDKRGNAWHYRESMQGSESNHYAGAIPVADVVRRLFDWEFAEGTVQAVVNVSPTDTVTFTDEGRKAIIRPAGSLSQDDPGGIVGVFSDGYTVHQYQPWLLQTLSTLLGDTMQVGSAGLLKNGAQAWVQVEIPETIQTPEGFDFRPFLMAATSADGTLATQYVTGSQATVCDNTMSAAIRSAAGKVKVKHTKHSGVRIADARDALGMVQAEADGMSALIADLCAVKVTPKRFSDFITVAVPMGSEGRGATVANTKREAITALYKSDPRVSPWQGTAFGVFQAMNTYNQHIRGIRGAGESTTIRGQRNLGNFLAGKTTAEDSVTVEQILALVK